MKKWFRKFTEDGVESTALDALPFSWILGISALGLGELRGLSFLQTVGRGIAALFIGFCLWAVCTAIAESSKSEKKSKLGRLIYELIALAVVTAIALYFRGWL